MNNQLRWTFLLFIATLVSADGRPEAIGAEQPPNVVLIFADDLGYGDISCYGPTGVETPHIDALAAEEFRNTDFFIPANACSWKRYDFF